MERDIASGRNLAVYVEVEAAAAAVSASAAAETRSGERGEHAIPFCGWVNETEFIIRSHSIAEMRNSKPESHAFFPLVFRTLFFVVVVAAALFVSLRFIISLSNDTFSLSPMLSMLCIFDYRPESAPSLVRFILCVIAY